MTQEKQLNINDLRLHHIGLVVADIDEAVDTYQRLGFTEGERHVIPEQEIIAVTYRAGNGWMELIQPTNIEGPIAAFMAKRGEGVHHVAYEVDDIVAKLAELKAAGVQLIDAVPRRGAHNWMIAFIHPKSCHGVLTELVQVPNE